MATVAEYEGKDERGRSWRVAITASCSCPPEPTDGVMLSGLEDEDDCIVRAEAACPDCGREIAIKATRDCDGACGIVAAQRLRARWRRGYEGDA